MSDKSNTNLSPVAKTVLDTLAPFYVETLRIPDPETGKALTEILNRMSKYGSEIVKDLTPDERDFFESQLKPMIVYISSKLNELRDLVRESTKNNSDKTEYNVKINFINGLKKETYKIEEELI
jgi:hypothetical protein